MIPYRCVCGTEYALSDDRAGKRTRCGVCRRVFVAPSVPCQEGARPAESVPARGVPGPGQAFGTGAVVGQRRERPATGLIIGAATAALGLVITFAVVLIIASRGPSPRPTATKPTRPERVVADAVKPKLKRQKPGAAERKGVEDPGPQRVVLETEKLPADRGPEDRKDAEKPRGEPLKPDSGGKKGVEDTGSQPVVADAKKAKVEPPKPNAADKKGVEYPKPQPVVVDAERHKVEPPKPYAAPKKGAESRPPLPPKKELPARPAPAGKGDAEKEWGELGEMDVLSNQKFIAKYPDSPRVEDARRRLRDIELTINRDGSVLVTKGIDYRKDIVLLHPHVIQIEKGGAILQTVGGPPFIPRCAQSEESKSQSTFGPVPDAVGCIWVFTKPSFFLSSCENSAFMIIAAKERATVEFTKEGVLLSKDFVIIRLRL